MKNQKLNTTLLDDKYGAIASKRQPLKPTPLIPTPKF